MLAPSARGFRRYLEGLLLPAERNKTLTALANTEPVAGAQRKEAQSLQWFLSESGWDPQKVNARRLKLLFEDPASAPNVEGVLVIDEHGDRKWGNKTAHVGKQWLGNIGKTDNGVVSVSSLWADERVYYPLEVEPYTPKHHFEGGTSDPRFRTKLKIAQRLVERSVVDGVPFRAVVADPFYGEDEGFRQALSGLGVGYVVALKESHSWWHKEGDDRGAVGGCLGGRMEGCQATGTVEEGDARLSRWAPGDVVGFGSRGGTVWSREGQRALVVSTDPERLPRLSTWYLTTNLPAPTDRSERANDEESEPLLAPASLAEVVRLYRLRMWVEQSYKQVKHALGWSDYQVRSDLAIRRHWQLVCLAFSFCWWAYGRLPTSSLEEPAERTEEDLPAESVERGEKETQGVVAGGVEGGEGVAGALCHALALLESVHQSAPSDGAKSAA